MPIAHSSRVHVTHRDLVKVERATVEVIDPERPETHYVTIAVDRVAARKLQDAFGQVAAELEADAALAEVAS